MTATKTTKPPAKRPAKAHGGARSGSGQKPVYRPEFCQIALDALKEGHSLSGVAGKLGVTRQSIFNWRNQYPEFDEAIQIGTAAAVAWWESRAMEAAKSGKGNPTIIIFGLKNRARDDWRDRVDHTHTGADDGPIQQEVHHTIEPSDAYLRMVKGGSQ